MGNRLWLKFKDSKTNVDIPINKFNYDSILGFSKTTNSTEWTVALMYEYHQQASIKVRVTDYTIETVKLMGGYEFMGDYTQLALNKGISIEIEGNTITFSGSSSAWKDLGDTASNDAVSQFRVIFNKGGYSGASKVNVTKQLLKCSADVGDNVGEGEQTITLQADNNYSFSGDIPYIIMGGEKHYFTLNNAKTVATIDININKDIKIVGIAKWIQKVMITGSLENCYCNYDNGEVYKVDKKIKIIADDGFIFKGKYNFTVSGSLGEFENKGNELIANNIIYNDDNIILFDAYMATLKTISLGGFINLYLVDDEELKALSNARFLNRDGDIVDYGNFIYNLYIIPFKLPSSLIGTKSNIILGSYDSKVSSTSIISYEYDVFMGNIEVPLKYNNMYDFLNVECFIHLPYTNKVWLSSEYVIGQTLEINCTIDLYNNIATYNIISSFNNEIVLTIPTEIGKKIPFIQRNMNTVNNVTNIVNKIDRCFIEVNRNIPYTKDKNIFGGSVVEYGKIGDYEGYIECDNVILETKANNQEQEEIKNLLNRGVFI